MCGSRHLTEAEAHYSTLEGEALAIAWCLQKARLFLLGCPTLTIATDHKALVKIFGDKELKDITNPRVLRLKEKTLMFAFDIKYLQGVTNCAADTLSRYPVLQSSPEDNDLAQDHEVAVSVAALTIGANDSSLVVDLDDLSREAERDGEYRMLHARVSAGDWGTRKAEEPGCLRPFYQQRHNLSCHDDLVMYAHDDGYLRIVVPTRLRRQVLDNLHGGHQGRDSMMRRARQAVYWPGLDEDVAKTRTNCTTCETHAPSSPSEPLIVTPPPDYPFQQVVADLFQLDGSNYLAYADRLTGWLEVKHLGQGTTSHHLITYLRDLFTRHGVPEDLSCDGGTNLVSDEMQNFMKKWRVSMRVSSAYYPQSNGRAEAAVKSAKRIIRGNTGHNGSLDTDAATRALLQYRNTPLQDLDISPAQMLAGRQLRDSVPTLRRHNLVSREWGNYLRHRERHMTRNMERMATRYNQTAHSLTPIDVGQRVRVQNPSSGQWDRVGVVLDTDGPRQYIIRMDGSGRVGLRNRRHLHLVPSPQPPSAPPSPRASHTPQLTPDTPTGAGHIRDTPQRPTRRRQAPRRFDDYNMY